MGDPAVKLTRSEFAKRCAYIASKAATWSGNALELAPEVEHVTPGAVAGFTDEIRASLDAMDRLAGRALLDALKDEGEGRDL